MPRRCKKNPCARAAVLAAAVATPLLVDASRLLAVNISLSFDAAGSAAFNPSFDPTGAGLQSIVQHVAGRYQDIFETAHNLTLTYRWGDLPGTELVRHTLTAQSGGRQTAGTIVFDARLLSGGAERSWFVDSTPADNAEFNMSQTLFRDLTAGQQSTFFNAGANVPRTFEAGYSGAALASAPAAAQTGLDLLTYAYSGVGQALGMDPNNASTAAEISDADYDLNPAHVFGRSLALDISSMADALVLNDFAVQDNSIRPAPGIVGARRLPGHGDLLAMAAVHNYTQVDIPRREYYGAASTWQTPGNWVGNQVPAGNDEVFVRDTDNPSGIANVSLAANAFAGALTIAETANVNTSTFTLNVGTLLTVRDLDTDLIVANGGTVSIPTGTLVTANNAQVFMTGGAVNAGTIINGAEIRGSGTLNVGTLLRNNGVLAAEGNPLTIATANASPVVDLDGQGFFVNADDGEVLVLGTTLTVPALTDTFTGTLSIGTNGTFNATAGWTLDDSTSGGSIIFGRRGVLHLGGGSITASAAKVAGGGFVSNGQVTLALGSMAQILSDATFNARSTVSIPSATLDLRGTSVLNGGSFIGGGGTLLFNGNVLVTADTTVNVNYVDLDGAAGNTSITINPGVQLELLTNNIDQFDNDVFNGTVNVNGGTLRVVTVVPWEMAGSLNFGGSGTIAGSNATYSGRVNANTGNSSINPTGTFTNAAQVAVNGPGTSLALGNSGGTTTIGGGAWTGTGQLRFNAGTTNFVANTTLGMAGVDLDGDAVGGVINVNPGVHVQVTGNVADPLSGTTFNLNSGTFTMVGGSPWTNDGTILLNSVSNTSTINGQGFVNNGTLIFGGSAAGDVNATITNNGTILVNQPGEMSTAAFNATGVTTVAAGRDLTILNTATLNGGSFTGAGRVRFDGPVNVTANTTIATAQLDLDGFVAYAPLTVNAGAALTINSATIDDLDNTYDGPATVSGALLVNSAAAWRKATDPLTLHNAGSGVPTVGGQDVFLDTTINATGGQSQFSATLRSDAGTVTTGTINVGAGANLLQNGQLRIDSASAALRKTGSGVWEVIGPQTHALGGDLVVSEGTLVMGSDAGVAAGNLDLSIEPGGAVVYNTRQRLNTHVLTGTAVARISPAGPTRVLRVNGQTMDANSTLDLGDNGFVQDHNGATPLGAIRLLIGNAYNGGLWNQPGITSVLADASSFGIGYGEAGDVFTSFPANFMGESIDGSTALVRFTRYGDANLDGTVSLGDFANLGANFNTPATWGRGDFNYDGQAGIADFSLLAANFNLSVPADMPLARGGAVPEPATAGLMLASMVALNLGRRPRGSRRID